MVDMDVDVDIDKGLVEQSGSMPLIGNVVYRPFYGWTEQAKIAAIAKQCQLLSTAFSAVTVYIRKK